MMSFAVFPSFSFPVSFPAVWKYNDVSVTQFSLFLLEFTFAQQCRLYEKHWHNLSYISFSLQVPPCRSPSVYFEQGHLDINNIVFPVQAVFYT